MPKRIVARPAAKGAHAQAIGRSRGGRTTKLHALVDGQGRPVALAITPGQLGDAPATIGLLSQRPSPRTLAADAAYDSNALRHYLLGRGTTPIIPNNPIRKCHHTFNRQAYTQRNVIERTFYRLTDFRRVATRYDKLASTYDAAICLAAAVIWWL